MRNLCAIVLLVKLTVFGMLGGCATEPDPNDAGVPARDECTAQVSVCSRKCAEADISAACTLCCRRQGLICDVADAGKANFASCME